MKKCETFKYGPYSRHSNRSEVHRGHVAAREILHGRFCAACHSSGLLWQRAATAAVRERTERHFGISTSKK